MQTVKFSQRTLQILKNFSGIMPSIQFKAGDTHRTMTDSRGVIADAQLDFSFETSFCVADLPAFLAVFSSFKEPEIQVSDHAITVMQGQRKFTFQLTRPDCIKLPPEGTVNFENKLIEFNLSQEFMADLLRSVRTIKHDFVTLNGDGTEVSISTYSENDPNSLTKYELTGLAKTDRIFKFVFRVDNLTNIMSDDYTVDIILKKGGRGLSRFRSKDVTYYVAVEANSKVDG